LELAVARVATAIRKFAAASSLHPGHDCYVLNDLAGALLLELGFEVHSVLGFAAWRVGPGPDEVIAHLPQVPGHLPPGKQGFSYHVWLEWHGWVVDISTYQLALKAEQLAAAGHGEMAVQWSPDYLLLPRKEIRSNARSVFQAQQPGLAYYERRPELETRMRADYVRDPGDLRRVRLVLAHPGAKVLGPMNAPALPRASNSGAGRLPEALRAPSQVPHANPRPSTENDSPEQEFPGDAPQYRN
jgi:hypothetical protein